MITQVRPPVEYPNSSNPHDEPSHLKNDTAYIGKENDAFATEEDLPDGINPVFSLFLFLEVRREIYTLSHQHRFFLSRFRKNAEDINFMISRGGIGCL